MVDVGHAPRVILAGRYPPADAAARIWAPFVALTAGGLLLNNVIQMTFNLDERRYQQRAARGDFVDAAAVRHVLRLIDTTNRITVVLSLAFVALAIRWSSKRRQRPRDPRWPEARVRGPRLRELQPLLWWSAWLLFVVAVVISIAAQGISSTATTRADVASFRGLAAASNAARAAMWACWLLMVVRVTWSGGFATSQQRHDLPRSFGDVRAGAEHGGDARIP